MLPSAGRLGACLIGEVGVGQAVFPPGELQTQVVSHLVQMVKHLRTKMMSQALEILRNLGKSNDWYWKCVVILKHTNGSRCFGHSHDNLQFRFFKLNFRYVMSNLYPRGRQCGENTHTPTPMSYWIAVTNYLCVSVLVVVCVCARTPGPAWLWCVLQTDRSEPGPLTVVWLESRQPPRRFSFQAFLWQTL